MGANADPPSLDEVQAALRQLATHAVEPHWLHEVGRPLLSLRQVRRRFRDSAQGTQIEEVVVEVLRHAAAELPGESRAIVEIVLALDPEYAGMTAQTRRTLAGKRFRGGARPVSWGTIRQHHEPKALGLLAARLVERDLELEPEAIQSEPAEPHTISAPLTCFVIGPIGNRHGALGTAERETYEDSLRVMAEVVQPACARVGVTPVRADSLGRAGEINEQIFRRLRDDDIVIADLTGANANVMYELGLRHTRNKLTVQIGEFGRLPFDINTIRTIQFSRSPIGLINARDELIDVLEAGIAGGYDPVTATRVWADDEATDDELVAVAAVDAETAEPGGADEDGLLEIMAEAEEQQEVLVPSLEAVAACVQALGELAEVTTAEIGRSDAAGKGMRGRLQIATRHAQGLNSIADRLDGAVDHYASVLRSVSAGTLALIGAMEEDSDVLEQGQEFGMATRQTAGVTRRSMGQLAEMVDSMNAGARLSRVLREPTRRLTAALDRFTEATSLVDEWDRRLQSLSVPMPPKDWTPDFDQEHPTAPGESA
jgi:hypothetical protein